MLFFTPVDYMVYYTCLNHVYDGLWELAYGRDMWPLIIQYKMPTWSFCTALLYAVKRYGYHIMFPSHYYLETGEVYLVTAEMHGWTCHISKGRAEPNQDCQMSVKAEKYKKAIQKCS